VSPCSSFVPLFLIHNPFRPAKSRVFPRDFPFSCQDAPFPFLTHLAFSFPFPPLYMLFRSPLLHLRVFPLRSLPRRAPTPLGWVCPFPTFCFCFFSPPALLQELASFTLRSCYGARPPFPSNVLSIFFFKRLCSAVPLFGLCSCPFVTCHLFFRFFVPPGVFALWMGNVASFFEPPPFPPPLLLFFTSVHLIILLFVVGFCFFPFDCSTCFSFFFLSGSCLHPPHLFSPCPSPASPICSTFHLPTPPSSPFLVDSPFKLGDVLKFCNLPVVLPSFFLVWRGVRFFGAVTPPPLCGEICGFSGCSLWRAFLTR